MSFTPSDTKKDAISMQKVTDSDAKPIYELYKFDDLSKMDCIAYGVGHFYNDLVAACWFNYLIYFLKNVL